MQAKLQHFNFPAENHQSPGPVATWRHRRVRMFPLWFFEGYLTLTLLVFKFGPWDWPVLSPIMLFGFLILVQIALWLGYKVGIQNKQQRIYRGRWKVEKLIVVSLIVNLVWIVPNFTLRMGSSEFSLSETSNAVASGITDPGTMYKNKLKALKAIEETSETPLIGYLTQVMSPILWLLLPLAIVFWDRLKTWMKVGTIVYIASDILSWIAIGTTKGLSDYVILLPWLLLMRKPLILTPKYSHQRAKIVFLGLALFVILLTYFSVSMFSRGSRVSTELYDSTAGISANRENIGMEFLPGVLQGAYASFASYLTQGYYGLSLAMEEPFVWTYGLGNSYYFTGLSRRFLGPTTISDMTYAARIEKYGWSRFIRWSSLYAWLACDVTFPGVLLLIFLLGWVLARVWLDVLRQDNPFAIVLFPLLIIALYYAPANNQVLGLSRTAIPFCTFLLLWAISRGHPRRSQTRIQT